VGVGELAWSSQGGGENVGALWLSPPPFNILPMVSAQKEAIPYSPPSILVV
jgi:hypothetical protein